MQFHLKAVDSANRVVALDLDAADEAAAREAARRQGYEVLAVGGSSDRFRLRRRSDFPTDLFAVELLALLEAGLNAVEALQTLAEKEPGGENSQVLRALLDALYRGESLSQAVARAPRAFPPLFVATIRSSERTGNLNEALRRYIAYQEELDKVRRKVVSALLYPAILLVVGALVLAFLLFYVVPRFARVYEDMSAELPLFSSILLAVGRWIDSNGLAAAAILLAALWGAVYALSRDDLRAALARRLWRLPALGERMMIYQLARFYRTVGMLLLAGVPALRSFEMVAGLLGPHLRLRLQRASELIGEGNSMSSALTATGLATPVATRMLAVGERAGRMGELMERIARFYDSETARAVDAFTRVFEPLLMTVLGLAVGLVVVLMYMPIFELAGSLR
ncbi:MAG: type II secretion system F family protein [Burkholderiales bacterium]